MPQFDGLRALAVSCVAIAHWITPYPLGLPFGAIGVLTFFVLSGFLISGILLDSWAPGEDESGRWRQLRIFYTRRFLRIFPLYYATLAIAYYLNVESVRETIGVTLTYVTNFHLFLRGDWQGRISHLWSLAVEEQFYLFWPFLVLFLLRRFLLWAIVGLIILAPLFRVIVAMALPQKNPFMICILTPGCLDALGTGALLAYMIRQKDRPLASSRVAAWLLWTGLIGFATVWTCLGTNIHPRIMEVLYPTFLDFIFGWVVLKAAAGFRGVVGVVLSSSPLGYLGKISYGLYVFHYIAPWFLYWFLAHCRFSEEQIEFVLGMRVLYLTCLATLTVVGAAVSWHFFEKPLNDLKRFFPQGRRPQVTCESTTRNFIITNP
jgi:peptidoglycan/LPS O-acetylase OafA/YrhL